MARSIVVVFGFTAALVAALFAQSADSPVVGPAVSLTGDVATLIWTSTSAATIKYGAYGRLDKATSATSTNQLRLTALKPGSVYKYEIPGLGDGSFATPPAPEVAQGLQRYTFAVLGDNRGNNEMYRLMANAIADAHPAFVVHTGNMVSDGNNDAEWTGFFLASRPFLRVAAFFPAMGALEKESPRWSGFFNRAADHYSFNWGRSHWIIMNSPPLRGPAAEAYWTAQMTWVEQDAVANILADFLFVVIHQPPFSAVQSSQTDTAAVNLRVVPVFNRLKVSAVFSGHDHNYQRHLNAGIPYIVTAGAGGGGTHADASIGGLTQKTDDGDNFVFGKVDGDIASFETRAASGRVLDKFGIIARKP